MATTGIAYAVTPSAYRDPSMLYLLLRFAMRPFRRWWRRMIVAGVVATLVVPAVRERVDEAVTGQPDTITIPHVP